jgi:hypothetical protein
VRDHGPGIADADRQRALEPFAQLEPARATDGSCGLGLAIVRRIVTGCGGELRLEAATGGGLLVVVRLPAAEVASRAGAAIPAMSATRRGSQARRRQAAAMPSAMPMPPCSPPACGTCGYSAGPNHRLDRRPFSMNEQEQQAILTLSLMAAFADGSKDESERAELKRIADALAGEGSINLAALYQDVLLKRVSMASTVAMLTSPEAAPARFRDGGLRLRRRRRPVATEQAVPRRPARARWRSTCSSRQPTASRRKRSPHCRLAQAQARQRHTRDGRRRHPPATFPLSATRRR